MALSDPRHYPVLVSIDGELIANNLSATSFKPRSRAMGASSKRRLKGMPRSGQLRTPETDIRSSDATTSAPPKLSKTKCASDFTSMDDNISLLGMESNPYEGCHPRVNKNNDLMTVVEVQGTIVPMRDAKKKPADNEPRRQTRRASKQIQDRKARLYKIMGKRLKVWRQAKGFDSAAECARHYDINDQTYRNYERGDKMPVVDDIARFADDGLSLEYLFYGLGPAIIERPGLGQTG